MKKNKNFKYKFNHKIFISIERKSQERFKKILKHYIKKMRIKTIIKRKIINIKIIFMKKKKIIMLMKKGK